MNDTDKSNQQKITRLEFAINNLLDANKMVNSTDRINYNLYKPFTKALVNLPEEAYRRILFKTIEELRDEINEIKSRIGSPK